MSKTTRSTQDVKEDMWKYFQTNFRWLSYRSMPATTPFPPPDELKQLVTTMSMGFVMIGLLGAISGGLQQAKLYQVEHEHLRPFKNASQAFHYLRERNHRVTLKAMSHGFKYGLLGLLFFGMYNGTELASELLREKKDPGNTALAGIVSGTLLGLTSSTHRYQNIMKGAMIGALIGSLCGCIKQWMVNISDMEPPIHEGKEEIHGN
jgi:hypothetical protein